MGQVNPGVNSVANGNSAAQNGWIPVLVDTNAKSLLIQTKVGSKIPNQLKDTAFSPLMLLQFGTVTNYEFVFSSKI